MDLGDIGAAVRIALTYFTILYLTGLGGLFSERSGIVNIGLEGMMVIGTVTGAAGVAMFAGPPPDGLGWGAGGVVLGLLFGALCGAMFASIHAVATINFRVDHIVSGVVINLVAIGLARFLSYVFFEQATQSDPGGPHLVRLNLPLLSDIPGGLGAAFSNLSPVVIFRGAPRVPRVVRALPHAVGAATPIRGREPRGDPIARCRGRAAAVGGRPPLRCARRALRSILVRGARRELAGGADVGPRVHRAGRADPVELGTRGASWSWRSCSGSRRRSPCGSPTPRSRALPPQFINMIPFVVTIVAIAGFVGRVRPPAAAGRAYEGAGGS